MPALVTIALLLVAGALFMACACTKPVPGPSRNSTATVTTTVTVQQVKSLSREEVSRMLSRIENSPAPSERMGAMCYEMAMPPDRAEYVCPVCGEKTLYSTGAAEAVEWELPSCRREFEQLQKASQMQVTLDESGYCHKCRPNGTPQLVLTLTYADGTTRTIAPVSAQDLRLLTGFFSGKLSYETFNEGELPLKNSTDRLKEMLGL